MSNHGTIVKKGETESRTTQVDKFIVTLHHVTQHKQLGDVVMDWSFDFEDVEPSKIMELASRSLVIDQRNAWKKLDKDTALTQGQTKQTFKVSDLIVKQKRGKSDAEKVRALMEGKTAEEIAAILEFAHVG